MFMVYVLSVKHSHSDKRAERNRKLIFTEYNSVQAPAGLLVIILTNCCHALSCPMRDSVTHNKQFSCQT